MAIARAGKRYYGKAAPRFRVRATALDEQGYGVGEGPDGGLVHVPGLLPGEMADVEVAHRSPHSGARWATLRRRDDAAPERVVPVCPAYGRCGGCVLQHLAYPAQLAWKRERLAQALRDAGVVPEAEVPACVPSPDGGLRARSRIKLVAGPGPRGLVLGAYAPRSHDVVDLAGCRLAAPALMERAGEVVRQANALGLRPYDEAAGGGQLRHVLLRQASGGEVQVGLVFAWTPEEAVLEELAGALIAGGAASVVFHENRLPGDVILPAQTADRDRVLRGPAALWDQVGPARVRVSPRSFVQVNRAVAGQLYEDVAALAAAHVGESEGTVLDLYCGVGGIGLAVLGRCPQARLFGVEENPAAVDDAAAGAGAAGLGGRAQFIAGDVSAAAWPEGPVALGVVNPPRRGLGPAVRERLAALRPARVAYVSCDPGTLAADLAALCRGGYHLLLCRPYDMHPHTPHVEALALLARPW